MNFAKRIAAPSLLASVLLSSTALADIGARDVWESWRSYLGGFGYDISASENTDGNTLNIKDFTLGMKIPEDDGTVTVEMGGLQFVENGDGTVEVVIPAEMPIHFLVKADGENVDGTITVSSKGYSTIVSGTPEEMVYTYNASEIGVALTDLTVDGEVIPGIVANAIMGGVLGRSSMAVGETVATQQKMSIETLNYTIQGTDPDGGGSLDVKGGITGIDMDFDGVVPLGDYTEDPQAFFEAGFDIAGGYTLEGSEMTMQFIEDGAAGNMSFNTGAGEMGMEMNNSIMAYSGIVQDVALNMLVPDVPLPIDVSFGEFGYGFEMPLQAGDEPQDFGFGLVLGDLSVSEMLWSMVDPGQVLPHDPATLVLDLSGKATLFADLMTLDEDASEVPGELNSLTLNELLLNIAGASVTGTGDFVFDNTDMQSFDGFPRPEGALDLNITGVNALMDKLVEMGLLPEEQAMGARMMMSMFSVPGEGEDTLTSTIEVNEQGHVLANGQRLK
ncbi:DUF2125 domain-containing protein [Shimia abyssi]|uniref:Uncharacterized protein DUF2125 n=1 Tax=Shimia abyssi TaxID=1662395 RepID=A0A2P8FHX3_9RHOB|nr:DUF2125 domain-containing protein [Shimia abyssi]PSL21324.1 uncharacterized protein DUF2125 [Shimia abyssi]